MFQYAHAAQCTPKPQERSSLPEFDEDISFDVQVRPTPNGSVIRITGDTIVINEETLASLVAEPSSPKTKISSLTFDGRIIRVAGSLAVSDAQIQLIGETIRFEKDGRISVQPGKGTQARRGFRMIAKSVEFSGGPKRPININLSADEKVTSEIIVENGIKSLNEAWNLHVDSLEFNLSKIQALKVRFGQQAASSVSEALKEEAEWPLFFAAKLEKHFNRSPYSSVTQKDVAEIVQRYESRMAAWRSPRPAAVLLSLKTAIRNQTDTRGRDRFFTPKKDLIAQRQDLRTLIDKNNFDLLARLIVSTANDAPERKTVIDSTRQQIAANGQSIKVKQAEISSLNSNLQQFSQSLKTTDDLIEQRREILKRMQQREFERMRDAQSVQQWTTVAASVVVIAASMGAATPAVAAGAAAGLSATGSTIYSHNAGKPFSLSEVIAAGTKSYEAAQKYQSAWSEFQESGKLRTDVYAGKQILKGPKPSDGVDKRQPWTKTEAAFNYISSLAAAAQAAANLNGGEVAGPTPLSLTDRENSDEIMKSLLVNRAKVNEELVLNSQKIESATKELDRLIREGNSLEDSDIELRAARAKNDQEAARWNASSLALWQQEVERISDAVLTFKRSLYFEAGAVPVGVPEVLDYPNELQSRITAGILDPFGGAGPLAPQVELRQRLDIQKDSFLASVEANYNAIVDSYRGYLDSRNDADVYRRVFELRADSSDIVKRRFIQALNGQIAQQIVGKTPAQSIMPAYIPIELPAPTSEYPERLISATIVGVKFNVPDRNIGVGALDFVVIHPGYGEMRRREDCFPADFRRNPVDWKRFTTTYEQINPEWVSRRPTKIEISETKSDRFYTFLPARTPYHLLVNVVSKNWNSLPRIESIKIGLEVMQ